MFKITIYFFIFTLFLGCSSPTETSNNENISRLFPLSVGNYWVYKEHFISSDTSYTVNYKSTVKEITNIGGFNWYKIETPRNDYIQERYLIAENDSVYELQYNWEAPVRSLQYIIPQDSAQEFGSLFGGDVGITKSVFILDTTISTNAGNFSNCIMFEYSTPDWTEREIISLGTGIVERQLLGYSISGGNTYQRITKLENFKINVVP